MPQHYRSFFTGLIRFALLMLVAGGLSGLVFQEFTKSLSYADHPPGQRLETVYHLALLHGHMILIGFVLPICMIAVFKITSGLSEHRASRKSLVWIFWTYLIGALSTTALIYVKGAHFVQQVKEGVSDFEQINASLFGGNRALRAAIYGTTHSLVTLSIIIFAVVAWRCTRKKISEPSKP